MLELYKFIFTDYFTFIGTVILILAIRGILTTTFWAGVKILKDITPTKK